MIIVKLGGGLGNQMFLYAMGRRLSIYHNTNMVFDLRGLYAGEDIRSIFELDVFGVYEQKENIVAYFIGQQFLVVNFFATYMKIFLRPK